MAAPKAPKGVNVTKLKLPVGPPAYKPGSLLKKAKVAK